jgi:osmotically-inducible protein OsmY
MNILRYELTDEKIKLGIESLFEHLKEISTGHVTVRVDQGFVTLMGTVKSQRDKELLGAQLNLIDGITDFENRLIVKMPKKPLPISVKSSSEAQD